MSFNTGGGRGDVCVMRMWRGVNTAFQVLNYKEYTGCFSLLY